ncbi:hypothetical protein GDO78_010073 [Eleutherodactylus coqui]|uniref:Uncharacterized protein n=1 Tax=Eleutherodactylus coqui TaxID=57060 RepID=A0A8J6FBV8_ELECQ|nr:hypothetical protein GDO78_010073 [Eleutherodactylus coqui]
MQRYLRFLSNGPVDSLDGGLIHSMLVCTKGTNYGLALKQSSCRRNALEMGEKRNAPPNTEDIPDIFSFFSFFVSVETHSPMYRLQV